MREMLARALAVVMTAATIFGSFPAYAEEVLVGPDEAYEETADLVEEPEIPDASSEEEFIDSEDLVLDDSGEAAAVEEQTDGIAGEETVEEVVTDEALAEDVVPEDIDTSLAEDTGEPADGEAFLEEELSSEPVETEAVAVGDTASEISKVELLAYDKTGVDTSAYRLSGYNIYSVKLRITTKDGTVKEVTPDDWEVLDQFDLEVNVTQRDGKNRLIVSSYDDITDDEIIYASAEITMKSLSEGSKVIKAGEDVSIIAENGKYRYYLFTPSETARYRIELTGKSGNGKIDFTPYNTYGDMYGFSVWFGDDYEDNYVYRTNSTQLYKGVQYLIVSLDDLDTASASYSFKLVKDTTAVTTQALSLGIDTSMDFLDGDIETLYYTFTAGESGFYRVFAEGVTSDPDADYVAVQMLVDTEKGSSRKDLEDGNNYTEPFALKKGETASIAVIREGSTDTGTIRIEKASVSKEKPWLSWDVSLSATEGKISDIAKRIRLYTSYRDNDTDYYLESVVLFDTSLKGEDAFGNVYTLQFRNEETDAVVTPADGYLSHGSYKLEVVSGGNVIESDYIWLPLSKREIDAAGCTTLTPGKAVSLKGKKGSFYFSFTPGETARYSFSLNNTNPYGSTAYGVLTGNVVEDMDWCGTPFAWEFTKGKTYIFEVFSSEGFTQGEALLQKIPKVTVSKVTVKNNRILFPFYNNEIQVELTYSDNSSKQTLTNFQGTQYPADNGRTHETAFMQDSYGNRIFIDFIKSDGSAITSPVFGAYIVKDKDITCKVEAFAEGSYNARKTVSNVTLKAISKEVKKGTTFKLSAGEAAWATVTRDSSKNNIINVTNNASGAVRASVYRREENRYYSSGSGFSTKNPSIPFLSGSSSDLLLIYCESGSFNGSFTFNAAKKVKSISMSAATWPVDKAYDNLHKLPVKVTYTDNSTETVSDWSAWLTSKGEIRGLTGATKNANYVDIYFFDSKSGTQVFGKTPAAGTYQFKATTYDVMGAGGIGISTTAKMTFTVPAKVSFNVSSVTLKYKQSTTGLKVTGLAAGDKVTSWKSSNTKIVKVSSTGKLTALKKAGTATITVTTKNGAKGSINVKVQKGTVATTKLTVTPTTVNVKKGKKATLKATRAPFTSGQAVKYKTSNKKIATVSSKGVITGKKAGTCTITVTSGKKTVKVKVTVTK